MGNGFFAVNVTLHDTVLVDTDSREDIQGILVARVDTVKNQADNDLLPSRTTLVPEFGLLEVDDVADVLHHTVQSTGGERLVFVVVGNGNEQLGVSVVHRRTKVVTVVQGELVGITRSGRV